MMLTHPPAYAWFTYCWVFCVNATSWTLLPVMVQTTATDLQHSLGALGKLATGYLALTDESSRILASESGLTQALVDEARAASETAADTSAGAAAAGAAHPADAPLVNIAEGTVLIEMAHALDVFDELADTLPGVKRLLIRSAPIRNVVERSRRAATGEPDPPPDEPPPPPPPPAQPVTPPAGDGGAAPTA